MRIVITGSAGLVGGAVLRRLAADASLTSVGVTRAETGDLGPETDWRPVLAGADVVIHCAARVHQLHDQFADPLAEFRKVNVEATLRLARQAEQSGVQRFIFLSSIKVNGEETSPEAPYRALDAPHPADAYGLSKLEAEEGLRKLSVETGLETVILRAPLVYGPGVKANMLRLVRWIDRGVPLPLGSVRNGRSLVAVDNLADAVATCMLHSAAANKTYLVSDQRDLSTPELITLIARALGRRNPLLPFPPALLKLGGALLGMGEEISRLVGSLAVDSTPLTEELGWRPPVSVETGIAAMIEWYRLLPTR